MMKRYSGHLALAMLGFSACHCSQGTKEPSTAFSILYDHRDLVEVQDLSGLEAGTQVVEFDAYVPRHEQWTESREQQLIRGIRVAHVDTRSMATTRVVFEPVEGHPNRRRVRVEMVLDREGSWVMRVAGSDLQSLQSNAEWMRDYDLREPESLGTQKEQARLATHLVLRTVGACNHVSKVATLPDDAGILRQVRLLFSEPIDKEKWTGGVTLDLLNVKQERVATARVDVAVSSSHAIQFNVPDWPDTDGLIKVHLSGEQMLAGGFGERLSCTPSDASVAVGYARGEQLDVELLVAPLAKAADLAFEESK